MRPIDKLLDEYAQSHQTVFNKRIHYICVPAIFFSLIGLLSCVPLPWLAQIMPLELKPYCHLGSVVIVLGLVYYLSLSFVLFLAMLLFSVLVLYGIYTIEKLDMAPLWLIMLGIFVVAWVFQFIGHNHEGKKPSFLKDIQFLMIGPAWTLSHLFHVFNIRF